MDLEYGCGTGSNNANGAIFFLFFYHRTYSTYNKLGLNADGSASVQSDETLNAVSFVNNFHSNIRYRKSSGIQGSDNANSNRIHLFIHSISFRLLPCVWRSSWCRCILWLPRDHCGTGQLNLRNPGRTSSTLWATANKSTSPWKNPSPLRGSSCTELLEGRHQFAAFGIMHKLWF